MTRAVSFSINSHHSPDLHTRQRKPQQNTNLILLAQLVEDLLKPAVTVEEVGAVQPSMLRGGVARIGSRVPLMLEAEERSNGAYGSSQGMA